jgi:hypothetical protein
VTNVNQGALCEIVMLGKLDFDFESV